MDYIRVLQNIGLTESEASIYIATLQLGPSSVIHIAQKVGLTRQMVYSLLPRLVERGLLKEVNVRNKKRYQVVELQALRDYGDSVAAEVRKAIPLLKAEQAEHNALPSLQVYENPISMREWYRRFMKEATPDDELLLWVTNRVWMGMDPDFLKRFVQYKNDQRIHDKIIAPDTKESRDYAQQMNQPYAEYRFMRQPWKSGAEKWIWRDTISYLTISENATNLIVVESAALAELERAAFMATWKTLLK